MERFWKAALSVAGIGAIGLFVFWSLYKQWLTLPGIFSQLPPQQTFQIFRYFLFLTFGTAFLGVAAYIITHNRTLPAAAPSFQPQATSDATKNGRLEEARELARQLASEIDTSSHVLLADGHTLTLKSGGFDETFEGVDPEAVLSVIQLPSRTVFESNVGKMSLLAALDKTDKRQKDEDDLTKAVLAFYGALTDFRRSVASAKLQRRRLTRDELDKLEESLQSRADFGFNLARRLSAVSDDAPSA